MLVTSHICWLKTHFLSMLTTDIQYPTSLCLLRSISQWFPPFFPLPGSPDNPTFPRHVPPLPHSWDSTEVPPWVETVPASPHLPRRSWYHSLPKTPLLSLQPRNPSFSPSVFPSPKHASLAPLDQLFFCLFRSSGRGKDCVYFLKCLIYPINESMNEWMKWMFTSCWVKSKFLKDFIQVCGWDAGSLEMPDLCLALGNGKLGCLGSPWMTAGIS